MQTLSATELDTLRSLIVTHDALRQCIDESNSKRNKCQNVINALRTPRVYYDVLSEHMLKLFNEFDIKTTLYFNPATRRLARSKRVLCSTVDIDEMIEEITRKQNSYAVTQQQHDAWLEAHSHMYSFMTEMRIRESDARTFVGLTLHDD